MGTGTGSGVIYKGVTVERRCLRGGEFGHIFAAAHLVQKYVLQIVSCGGGKVGCIVTWTFGLGITRLAK